MDENIFTLESLIPSSEGLVLKYSGSEGKIILSAECSQNSNLEEWFTIEEFEKFIGELKDFLYSINSEVKYEH